MHFLNIQSIQFLLVILNFFFNKNEINILNLKFFFYNIKIYKNKKLLSNIIIYY